MKRNFYTFPPGLSDYSCPLACAHASASDPFRKFPLNLTNLKKIYYIDSHFNCALFKNKTYSTYKDAFVVQRLKQVAHPTFVTSLMTSQRKILKGARLAPSGFRPLTLLFKIRPK